MENQIHVLLAEDTPSDVRLTEEAFKRSGLNFTLDVAHDGVEAIQHLTKIVESNGKLPDVMLLDLNMPRKNGHEVLKEMKEHAEFSKIPVILLTVSQREEDVMEALKLKMNYYLAKPITHQKLYALVKSVYELNTDNDAGGAQPSKNEETHIKFILAGNPHTSGFVLRKLSSDESARVRAKVAENPETPQELLLTLAQDKSEEVRAAIADNPKAPEAILRKLASDASDDVRLNLANSGRLPSDVLETLASDENPYVVDAAKKSMAKV